MSNVLREGTFNSSSEGATIDYFLFKDGKLLLIGNPNSSKSCTFSGNVELPWEVENWSDEIISVEIGSGINDCQPKNYSTYNSPFENCSNLKKARVTGECSNFNHTFLNCSALEEFILEDNEILAAKFQTVNIFQTFRNCTSLKRVVFLGIVDLNNAFENCFNIEYLEALKLYYVSYSDNYSSTDPVCHIKNANLGLSIKSSSLSNLGTFMFHTGIENLTLDMTTSSYNIILSDHYKLSSMYSTQMDNYYENHTLKNVVLKTKENVTYRLRNVFANCRELENFQIIGPHYFHICEGLFTNCRKLKELHIDTISFWGAGGYVGEFENCESLEEITFKKIRGESERSAEPWLYNTFLNCKKLKKLYLNFDNSIYTQKAQQVHFTGSCFGNCESLEELEIYCNDPKSFYQLQFNFNGWNGPAEVGMFYNCNPKVIKANRFILDEYLSTESAIENGSLKEKFCDKLIIKNEADLSYWYYTPPIQLVTAKEIELDFGDLKGKEPYVGSACYFYRPSRLKFDNIYLKNFPDYITGFFYEKDKEHFFFDDKLILEFHDDDPDIKEIIKKDLTMCGDIIKKSLQKAGQFCFNKPDFL